MDESLRFYTQWLGMEIVERRQVTEPTSGEVAGLRSPGSAQYLELNWYREGTRFGSPYTSGDELDHLAFEVDDVDAAVHELETRGVDVLVRSREIGDSVGWREAFVRDPNGIWIELLPRSPAGIDSEASTR
jgi:catechol 2,3-dioxygenase-like lactoylglutathione lyase family enzyme